jgi:DNA-binding HxlR family transcriptional regulator
MEDGTSISLRNLCDTNDGRDTRRILDLIGDKWSLLVIHTLEEGTLRFSELRRLIEAISQRVLTRTLRQLERNGLVTRTVVPTIPPRVSYTLTELGRSLLEAVRPLLTWAIENRMHIERAAQNFDRHAVEMRADS